MGRLTWITGLVLCVGLTDRQTASGQPVTDVMAMDRAEVPHDILQRSQHVAGTSRAAQTQPAAPAAPGQAQPTIVLHVMNYAALSRDVLDETMARVDATPLDVTVVNSTTITVIVPAANTAGPADVVVTNASGLSGTLTAAFTYSREEPYAITPSTHEVEAGGQMSVSWEAPAPQPGDWLALFRVGATYEDDWYGLINCETSGTRVLTSPTRAGLYEFRYLIDLNYRDVARSSPVTVR